MKCINCKNCNFEYVQGIGVFTEGSNIIMKK